MENVNLKKLYTLCEPYNDTKELNDIHKELKIVIENDDIDRFHELLIKLYLSDDMLVKINDHPQFFAMDYAAGSISLNDYKYFNIYSFQHGSSGDNYVFETLFLGIERMPQEEVKRMILPIVNQLSYIKEPAVLKLIYSLSPEIFEMIQIKDHNISSNDIIEANNQTKRKTI